MPRPTLAPPVRRGQSPAEANAPGTAPDQRAPEFIHSLLAARRGPWTAWLAGGGALPDAPALLGNRFLAGQAAAGRASRGKEPADRTEASPEGEAAPPDAAPPAVDEPPGPVPIKSGAAPEADDKGAAKPAAAPAKGGGAVAMPTATTAQGLQQQAQATARSLPPPPVPAKGGQIPAPRKRPRPPPPQPGPPPIPVVKPSYADVTDPIPEATKRIETAANQTLPEQALPPAETSPGGHMPDFSVRPLTASERQLLKVGEDALEDAQLSPTEFARLKDLRDRLLAPPAPAPEAGPPTPPPQIKVNSEPLPPAEMTVAEQELFTGVLARLGADSGKQAKEVLDAIKAGIQKYPDRALFNTDFPALQALGESRLLPAITEKLKTRVAEVAQAVGVAGRVLDDAVAARRQEAKVNPERAAIALQAQADALAGLSVDDTAARLAEAEKARALAEDAKEKAKGAEQKPKPGFKDMAEAAVARIKDKVTEAIAGFRLQEKERLAALDQAKAFQLAAYEDAITADQIVAAKANAPSGNPPGVVALLQASKANSEGINAGRTWLKEKKAALDSVVDDYKDEVKRLTKVRIEAVEAEGAAAYRDLRAWGDAQEGGAEGWWQDSAKQLDAWAAAAHDTAATWANVEGRLARLELQRDFQHIRRSIDAGLARDKERGVEYQALTADRKREFVDAVVAERRDGIMDGLARNLVAPLVEAEREAGELAIDAEILALPNDQWPALNYLAKLTNPGFDAQVSATAIYDAGEGKWARTDEDEIFKQLTNLRPIELAALTKCYEEAHGPGSLRNDLDWELSGDAWRRAEKLLNGEQGAAAAEAIHDAVWGPGVNKEKIVETLRALPPDQRDAANAYYLKEYGETLDSRLGGDLEGSALGEARSLLAGKKGDAYAYELDKALRTRMGGGDRAAAQAVYDRIRGEAMAEARKQGWNSAEYEAEVERRNAELEQAFEDKFAKVGKYHLFKKNQNALQGAISYAFTGDPTQAKLVRALANNDLAKAEAAMLQHEREGVYADDDVQNAVIDAQLARARDKVDLDRAPAKRIGIDNQLKREEEAAARTNPGSPPPRSWTERDRMDRKMALERKMKEELADLAFEEARRNSAVLDTVLKTNHKIGLDQMIDQNMSGRDRDQARDRVRLLRQEVGDDPAAKEARRLDWTYNQIRYSIEGAGTTLSALKAGMAGLSKAEIAEIDRRWRRDHDGETLREAIQGDTGGRDEGDLLDTVDYGAPATVAERMGEARRKLQRDEAATGLLGRWASGDHTAAARRAVAEMEKLNADLDNPGLSAERRAHLRQMVDQRIDRTHQLIESRRTAVDALADTLTTGFQYVVGALAIVAGAVATVVTGGGALPILIAIVGSVVGTLGSMAIKQAVKGGDYSGEEIATDLAIGAVDAIVTAVAAGAFKGGTFLKGLGVQLKQWGAASIKVSLRQALKRSAQLTVQQSVEQQAKRAGSSAVGRTARWAATGAKNMLVGQAHNILPTLPTTLTANLLNEENLRHGNPLRNIAKGTLEQSIEGLKMGLGMAAFGHAVNVGLARAATVAHPPMSSPLGRQLDFARWQVDNPGKPRSEYVAQVEAQQARAAAHEAQVVRTTKEVRTALADQLPPRDRAIVADVPIVHLSDGDFNALSRGKGNGDAILHVKDGQAAIVVRAGAESPAAAVKGLATELRETVAPGTAGRTVNPADSLPPHLRNRVLIEPSSALGPHGVKATPLVDAAGNIVGVQLDVGPLARASDIRNHVRTIEGMRKYIGLLGEVRLKLLDIGQKMHLDLVSPRQQGRWEAALEIAKLPDVIEDHVRRLAETGLDPRRRSELEGRIENLRAQFEAEKARFAKGADAEARGYVAAAPDGPDGGTKPKKGRGSKGATPEPEGVPAAASGTAEPAGGTKPRKTRSRKSATPEAENAPAAATAAAPAAATPEPPITPEKLARIERVLELMRRIEKRGADAYGNSKRDVVTEPRNKFAAMDAVYLSMLQTNAAIRRELPQALKEKIAKLGLRAEADTLTGIHKELLAIPAVELMLASGKPPEVATVLQRADKQAQKIIAWEQRQAGYERTQAIAEGRVAKLASYFETLGKVIMGVPIHPDLPPLAQSVAYKPKEVTGKHADGSEKTAAEKAAHINGYRSELRLGNEIVNHRTDIVVQYANAAGINGADAISVNRVTGEVTLWDSKYRSTSKTYEHSDTFEKDSKREKALKRARAYVDQATNLPPHIKVLAQAFLAKDTFYTTTSYTDGGPFTNVTKHYTKAGGGVEVPPPW